MIEDSRKRFTKLQRRLDGWDLCYSGLRHIAHQLGLLPAVPIVASNEDEPDSRSTTDVDHRIKILEQELSYLEQSFDPFQQLSLEVNTAVSCQFSQALSNSLTSPHACVSSGTPKTYCSASKDGTGTGFDVF